MRPRTLLAVIVTIVGITTSCDGLGGEGGAGPKFYWVIVNDSDENIFSVSSQRDENGVPLPATPDQVSGNFGGTILAGETAYLGQGSASIGDADGGCFNGQHGWIVRSRSGSGYAPRTPIDEFQDDLEILTYMPPLTCTDQEELVWEYSG